MALCDEVRNHCARVAGSARAVTIDLAAFPALAAAPVATLDPHVHHLDGPPEDVARYLLTLDSINFGSGWFPTLRKRAGCSGYTTVASMLSDRFRAHGPWSNAELRSLEPLAQLRNTVITVAEMAIATRERVVQLAGVTSGELVAQHDLRRLVRQRS